MNSEFWDRRYSTDDFLYGELPNEFLAEMVTLLVPNGSVFVPGDGEGRNGVWLARRGFYVTTVDSSVQGVEKARSLASRHGVRLLQTVVDLYTWEYPKSTFDAAVLIYLHLPESIRLRVHQQIASSLKPGGIVIVECFHPQQLNRNSGGPKDISMLYDCDLLRSDFKDLLTPHFEYEGNVLLAEGAGHSGLGYVSRWVGRKIS